MSLETLKVSYEDPGITTVKSRQWIALTGNGINQTLNGAYQDVAEAVDAIKSRMEIIEGSNYFQV